MVSLRTKLRATLKTLADPQRAAQQQAYMKSTMQYAGLTAPVLRKACKEIFHEYPFASADTWSDCINELWDGADYREERYAAIELLGVNRYQKQWLTTQPTAVTGAHDTIRRMVGLRRQYSSEQSWLPVTQPRRSDKADHV